MAETRTWQLLFVDDDPDFCDLVKEYLEGENVGSPNEQMSVKTLTDFDEALEALERHRFDLLILDVRLGSPYSEPKAEEAGTKTLEEIKQRRFVPVIFYTALPNLVKHLETSVIQVVEKEEITDLLAAIKNIFDTPLPTVNRALIRHLETVQRGYMWDFVAKHGADLIDTSDRTALAYLLARRLAMYLSGPGIRQLAQDLGDSTEISVVGNKVHPMQYYVMPPVETSPLTGDLYQGNIEGQDGYWVLLTPSCDLVTGREKAKWVLMAPCVLLTEEQEYQDWDNNFSQAKQKKLTSLLSNNRSNGHQPERFYFLPGALDLPDLVVDFQQLVTLPREQMEDLERLASLDSPFAEAVLTRFSRYFGRLGTPDLDIDFILNKLQS